MRGEYEAERAVEELGYRLRDHLGWSARAVERDGHRADYIEYGLDLLNHLVSAKVDMAIHQLLRDQSFFELLMKVAGSQDDGK